jgi:predicted PurR-regulated permease PerM
MGADEHRGRDGTTRFLLVAASLVVIVAGIRFAASLLLPFLIAFFLAMVSLPLLNWLQSKRIPTILAMLITVIVVVAVLFSFGALIGGSISGFTEAAPRYRARLEDMLVELIEWIRGYGVTVPEEFTKDIIQPGAVMDLATTTLRGVAAVVSNLLLVVLTIIFIYIEAAGIPAKLEAAFGGSGTLVRLEKIQREINHYLGIKTLISLVTGVLIGTAMTIIGVDFPVLWGTLAFLLNYIPNLGSILSAIPPMLLAAVQLGWAGALAVALVFAVVNMTLGSLIEPYLMGRRLGLSPLVIFLSLIFWGWVWGPVGMLLSVPITMVLKITLDNSKDLQWLAVLLDAGPGLRQESAGPGETG